MARATRPATRFGRSDNWWVVKSISFADDVDFQLAMFESVPGRGWVKKQWACGSGEVQGVGLELDDRRRQRRTARTWSGATRRSKDRDSPKSRGLSKRRSAGEIRNRKSSALETGGEKKTKGGFRPTSVTSRKAEFFMAGHEGLR